MSNQELKGSVNTNNNLIDIFGKIKKIFSTEENRVKTTLGKQNPLLRNKTLFRETKPSLGKQSTILKLD
jgi:hypothetical protein